MNVRDRIRELRRVPAPRTCGPTRSNWRVHPASQHDALRGMLAEIGYADALVARETADGALELLDGHLRAEITPDAEVPVLVVDLDDVEAAKLLALLDPLAAMAQTDETRLESLLADVHTDNPALEAVLHGLRGAADALPQIDDAPLEDVEIPEAFQVVVECGDEAQQRTLYERLSSEGLRCRLLTL